LADCAREVQDIAAYALAGSAAFPVLRFRG
jgi:hypothetical protein